MNGKEFIRELEEAMLKIELSNKRILLCIRKISQYLIWTR